MYHPFSKNDPLVRKALYEAYSKKCAYCGDLIQPKNMHIDHILATNAKKENDIKFNRYIDELMSDGFLLDSLENYRPSCASCNLKKNNENFSVANLRFYHEEAQKKAIKALSILDKYKDQQISFDEFDPDYDCWEKIDFSRQKDISEAIAGYRLQPCHVQACPRLSQVESIKKRLKIVDYVIVEGESGCGKSISLYQAAYDLSMNGYIVYRYINKNADSIILFPRSNEKKLLFIIDDAQNLPTFSLEQVIAQSQSQTKIILAFTKIDNDTNLYSEPIRITNYDAVKTIAQDYKKRKREVLPIVQQFDKYVGDNMFSYSFEKRLDDAAKKDTPWLFNYTLRGGWSTVNEQFQAVYKHNKCGLLSTIIALFQILRLDGAVDFKWLQTYIQKFDIEISWTKNDLDYLVRNKLIASPDDVRIVHIESASHIVRCFFKIANAPYKQLICRILEDGYDNNLFNIQGLLWLQSAVSSSPYYLEDIILTEKLLDSVFSDLDSVNDEKQRGFTVYLLERILNLHREKNGKYYFKQNEQLLAQWISETTSKNAYEYSRLINTLNNQGKDCIKSFVSKIDVDSVLRGFADCSVEDLFCWCKLLDRLSFAYDQEERIAFGERLRDPLTAKDQFVTAENIDKFYGSISEICYLNPNLIFELLSNHIDKFQKLWFSKPEYALEVMTGFSFLYGVFGISYFSNKKLTKQQKEFSIKFTKAMPIEPIANYISHSLPRAWNSIYDMSTLLYRDNKRKLSQIIKAIDDDSLNDSSSALWEKTDRDLCIIFSSIACGELECAQRFFEKNKDKIKELGVVFISALPKQSIDLFKKGVKLRLFEEKWNTISFDALEALHDVSEDDYKEILDCEISQVINRINELCILDFEKYEMPLYEIVVYIKKTYPDILLRIVPALDYDRLKKEKQSMLKDSRFNRRCRKLFNNMIDLLIEYADNDSIIKLQVLKSLRNR